MSNQVRIGTAMLLDDETIDQRHHRRVLERSGLVDDVIPFSYPDDALDYFRNPDHAPIDVLFLDINMPRLNGFEFLEAAIDAFGSNFEKTPVIMLTTSLDPQDQARAQSFPVVKSYLNKPLRHADLDGVCELLNKTQAEVIEL